MNTLLMELAEYLSESDVPRSEWVGFIERRLAPTQQKVYYFIMEHPGTDTLAISYALNMRQNYVGNTVADLLKLHLLKRELAGGIYRYWCKGECNDYIRS